MKQIIDIETWERKDNFLFFSNFINPQLSFTTEIDCTEAKAAAKSKGESFFLYYLYAILRACNEVKEFRYRIGSKGEVELYDFIDSIVPILRKESGAFSNILIPYHQDFRTFYKEAKTCIENIPDKPQAYDAINKKTQNKAFNIIVLSATPDLYFSAIAYPQEHPHGSNYPLMNVGKAIQRHERWLFPFALSVHHGFVDGFHIQALVDKIANNLRLIAL